MHLPRRWWAWALVAVVATFAVDRSSRSNRLFPRAEPIPLTHGIFTNALFETGYDARRSFTISWFLESNQVIRSYHRNPAGMVELHRLDLARSESFTTSHPAALRNDGAERLTYWIPSPDGQWLLTVRRFDQRRLYQVYGSDQTLRASWTHRHEGRSQPDWLNDSSGFVEWPIRDGRLLARVHWLDTGQSTEVDALALPSYYHRGPEPLPQPCVALLYSPPSTEIAAEFLILAPDRDPGSWKRAIITLPEPLRHHEQIRVTLSPTTDQLAWLCESTSRQSRLSFSRLPPYVQFQPRLRSYLFLSRPDGSQLTPLGRTPPGATIPAVRWSPEGDRLTFVYENALWLQDLSPR